MGVCLNVKRWVKSNKSYCKSTACVMIVPAYVAQVKVALAFKFVD